MNPNKEKIRIVFDCAAEYRGQSLNNEVLQGPDLSNKTDWSIDTFSPIPCSVHGGHTGHVPSSASCARRSGRVEVPVVA